ncbi:MAG: galactokinase family protein [Bacteroidota bacterium]
MPSRAEQARARFRDVYGRDATGIAFAPGRVNLIGEHIDYHGGPVLPAALSRGITVAWAPRPDATIRASSTGTYPGVEFDLHAIGDASRGGGWANYLKAAASMVGGTEGMDLLVASDLPEASGLSSSSALVVATGLALLSAHRQLGDLTDDRRLELATRFAEAERYVGTAGGGMDQAASLGGRADCALRIDFNPLRWRALSIPETLSLIVAHTGVRAEKSGAVQARYNAIRAAHRQPEVAEHIRSEIERVEQFEAALTAGDAHACGELMNASHASLRDRLRVSHPALDELVGVAREAGACGARMTGAGFGGSIVCLAEADVASSVSEALRDAQTQLSGAELAFIAEPGDGASSWREP